MPTLGSATFIIGGGYAVEFRGWDRDAGCTDIAEIIPVSILFLVVLALK